MIDEPAPLPVKPRLQCHCCKLESEWVEAFHKVGKPSAYGAHQRYLCPRCRLRSWRTSRLAIGIALAIVLQGAVIAVCAGSGWLFANAGLLYFWLFFLVLPHEAGQVLMAWLLGRPLNGVVLGLGPTVKTFQFGRFRLTLKRIPAGGLIDTAQTNLPFLRVKDALLYLAGPGVNLALMIAALWWFRIDFFSGWVAVADEFEPGVAFVMANGFLGFGTLLPYYTTVDGRQVASDGLGLLMSLFLAAVARGAHDAYGGEFGKARDIWHSLLPASVTDTAYRLALLDAIAVADLMIGNPELLPEADAFSAESVQTAPWEINYQATRGGVLIALGQIDQGKTILEAALHEPDHDHGCVHAFLALAAASQSRSQEADRHMAEARKLSQQSWLIDRMAQHVANALAGRNANPS